MKVTRIYTDSNGETHFEDKEISFIEEDKYGKRSQIIQAKTLVFFGETPSNIRDSGWHSLPFSCYFIVLEGSFSIEVSDGSTRTFKPADVLLIEHEKGKGHNDNTINDENVTLLVIKLDKKPNDSHEII